MIKKILILLSIFFGAALVFIFNTANAQSNSFNLNFPISELGNCGSYDECKAYCDDSTHANACFSFAEKNGLVKKEEAGAAKEILEKGGPGGCKSEAECKTYCDNGGNIDECVAFAEKYHLIPPEELKIAKKVQQGGGPGGCRSRSECDTFCSQDQNLDVCLKFAEDNNLISPEELVRAKKMGNKPGPGGCRGPACKTYCDNPDNFDACLKFAEENGLIDPKEAEMARKIGNKPGPGGCKGEACKTYCDDRSHQEECFKFAKDNGLIPPEELQRAEKFMNLVGPGGCRGDTCRTYCEDRAHQEECFKFAKENDLIPSQELERIEKMQVTSQNLQAFGGPGGCKSEDDCRNYCDDPSHTQECMNFAQKAGIMRPEEARQNMQEFQMRAGEMDPLSPNTMGSPPAIQNGPGGCASPEECIKFCSSPENRSTCASFGPPVGGPPPGGTFRQAPPSSEGKIPGSEGEVRKFENREGEGRFNQLPGFENQRPPEGLPQNQFPQSFQPPQNFQPPTNFQPPENFQPPTGAVSPPPSGEVLPPPPPPETTRPQSFLQHSLFGMILNFFLGR